MSDYANSAYAVHDGSLIWGVGPTVEQATAEARSYYRGDDWDNLTTIRCTQALRDLVNERGGDLRRQIVADNAPRGALNWATEAGWGTLDDGTLCTLDEMDAQA